MSLDARAIALQGIGYSPALIALQGFLDFDTPSESSGRGSKKKRRYVYDIKPLVAFANFLDKNELELPAELLEESEEVLETAKVVLEDPITLVVGDDSWQEPYEDLKQDFNKLRTIAPIPKSLKTDFNSLIDRIVDKIQKEEEELIIILLEMDEI
jgi:hypothetical protein